MAIGIGVLLTAMDVTFALRGDASSWFFLAAPAGLVAAAVAAPRRLGAVLDVLEGRRSG